MNKFLNHQKIKNIIFVPYIIQDLKPAILFYLAIIQKPKLIKKIYSCGLIKKKLKISNNLNKKQLKLT